MSDVVQTLQERGSRYGTFVSNGRTSQQLKEVLRNHPNWAKLSDDQREALEMIVHKIARIMNGDPKYVDSWHDIAGYAQLVEQELLSQLGTSALEAELKAVSEATQGSDGQLYRKG